MALKAAFNLFDARDHKGSHVMFCTALKDGKDWGANPPSSPVFAGPYWFLSSQEASEGKQLPMFAVEVPTWSDGTAALAQPP